MYPVYRNFIRLNLEIVPNDGKTVDINRKDDRRPIWQLVTSCQYEDLTSWHITSVAGLWVAQ